MLHGKPPETSKGADVGACYVFGYMRAYYTYICMIYIYIRIYVNKYIYIYIYIYCVHARHVYKGDVKYHPKYDM